MATEYANTVIAGKYQGATVAVSYSPKCAYIKIGAQFTGDEYIMISKNTVSNIEDVTTTHYTPSATGTAIATGLLGVGAGIAAAKGTDHIIKQITWKDGSTSLVKLIPETNEALIVGMYNDISTSQESQVLYKQRESDKTFQIILSVIILGLFVLYLFAAG